MKQISNKNIHPLWLRINHWINALAVMLMILSGWRIYNASPLFAFSFPKEYTLGGWLGGALQWHFAVMWLFGLNGLLYLIVNIISGRFRQRFWPLSVKQLISEFISALKWRLGHDDRGQYNMVQKCAYLLVMVDGILFLLSGLVLWKSVQFAVLRELLGGYDNARLIHFSAMAFLCLFILVHLAMVLLVPKTLKLMIRGR